MGRLREILYLQAMTYISETEYRAKCGRLTIWTYTDSVVMCRWQSCDSTSVRRRILRGLKCRTVKAEESTASKELKRQLNEYFAGERKSFNIQPLLIGSDFQKAAWTTITGIHYGQTISYKQEAIQAGHPTALRAIGNANRENPIVIVIPCHRVVGSEGMPRGYAGGTDIQRFLNETEQKNLDGDSQH